MRTNRRDVERAQANHCPALPSAAVLPLTLCLSTPMRSVAVLKIPCVCWRQAKHLVSFTYASRAHFSQK